MERSTIVRPGRSQAREALYPPARTPAAPAGRAATSDPLGPTSEAELDAELAPLAAPVTELPTMVQQQADALTLFAETALRHELDPGAPGERYQVVVHVDAAVLADPEQPGQSVLEDGVRVSAETSQRLACDASRVVMRHDADGRVVEVGARTRTIPPALRRALQHRDRGCRFPGLRRAVRPGSSPLGAGCRRADVAPLPSLPRLRYDSRVRRDLTHPRVLAPTVYARTRFFVRSARRCPAPN